MKKRVDIVVPGPAEDAAITAAALTDPDNLPVTDAEFAGMPPAEALRLESGDGVEAGENLDLLLMLHASGGELQQYASALLHERLGSR